MCECGGTEPKWKSENKCKEIFEKLFVGYKFPKQRPYFLNKMELDGYSQRLLLAFEFDGKQHFEQVKTVWLIQYIFRRGEFVESERF